MAQASPSAVDWIARARQVAPVLREQALASERAGTLTDAAVQALGRAGLFGLAAPAALGGGEQGFGVQLGVYEELARADGSAGWCAMACASSTAFAGAFCGADAAREMFDGRSWVAFAGQFAPRGRGVVEEGGYRLTGDYSFGSGSAYSQYIAGGFIPFEGEAPRTLGAKLPELRIAVVPRERVLFRGNWLVAGLQGTGSFDYGIQDQHVPDGCTFSLFETEPRTGGALYRAGVLPITAVGHAGFALGVGRRALDEISQLAHVKIRMGADTTVAKSQRFQHELARAEAKLSSARAFVHEAFGALEDHVLAGDSPTLELRARVRLATTWVTEMAAEVADFAYRAAGTDSLRLPSDLQRAWRDVHASTQHIFVEEGTYVAAAQVMLGLAPRSLAL